MLQTEMDLILFNREEVKSKFTGIIVKATNVRPPETLG